MIFKTFGWSFALTALALVIAFFFGSWEALAITAILIVIEITLSFDNSIINARVLEGMSLFWRKMFLTVGILIAVFGVRFVLPVVLVSATTGLGPWEVTKLAFENGDPHVEGTYGYYVLDAHPQLASLAGMFLLMLFFSWLFGKKDHPWLKPIEVPLGKLEGINPLPTVLSLITLVVFANINSDRSNDILISGLIGLIAFLTIDGISGLFEQEDEDGESNGGAAVASTVGKSGFMGFMYLEFLDASFSMDSLGAALAITSSIVIIILGLGVGAIYVRSMTIYLVNSGSLNTYRYLESGAMWAIGALAFILFISIQKHVPELLTGGIGIAFVGAAFAASVIANRRDKAHGIEPERVTTSDIHHPHHDVDLHPHLPHGHEGHDDASRKAAKRKTDAGDASGSSAATVLPAAVIGDAAYDNKSSSDDSSSSTGYSSGFGGSSDSGGSDGGGGGGGD